MISISIQTFYFLVFLYFLFKRTQIIKKIKKRKSLFSLFPLFAAVGWKYRLQLNLYKYIVEKYYGFSAGHMLVVDMHPGAQQDPFVDEVPSMQADLKPMIETRAQQLLMSHLQGGATTLSQASMDEETEEDAVLAAVLQLEAEKQTKNVPVKLEQSQFLQIAAQKHCKLKTRRPRRNAKKQWMRSWLKRSLTVKQVGNQQIRNNNDDDIMQDATKSGNKIR